MKAGAALLLALMASSALAGITLDTGFPKTVDSKAQTGTSVTTASFSTTSTNEVMVASFVCADETAIFGTNDTDITLDGAGLTWTKTVTNTYTSGAFDGFYGSQIWTALASSALTSQTVTIHSVSSNAKTCVLGVYALKGACTTTFGAQGGENDAACNTSQQVSATVNVVAANSFLVGNFGDGNGSAGITSAGNTTLDVTDCDGSTGTCNSVGRLTSLTSGAGNVTFGTTNTDTCNVSSGLEILDAAATQCTAGGATSHTRSLLGVGGRRPRPRRRRPLLPPRLGFFESLGDIWRELTHVSYPPAGIGVGT